MTQKKNTRTVRQRRRRSFWRRRREEGSTETPKLRAGKQDHHMRFSVTKALTTTEQKVVWQRPTPRQHSSCTALLALLVTTKLRWICNQLLNGSFRAVAWILTPIVPQR